ncbi:MAG: hypothetical protein K1X67_04935 [Fimbriimonadaceae bacterium]|nr:hypothetical protein [Fimbriimonadaceae bacterium]
MPQINDGVAISEARPIVGNLAPTSLNAEPRVTREILESARGQTEVIQVSFGDTFVWLTGSGSFRAFASPSKGPHEPTAEPDKYATDEAAWRAFEAILAGFELPSGLERLDFVRDSKGEAPYTMRFTMRPRPYGYDVDGGNGVRGALHRKTGQVLSLSITGGWIYEAPNVRVSRQQAIEATRLAHGGDAQEWRVSLKYSSIGDANAPAHVRELNASKTMRLFYFLRSARGSVTVDSVTGDIVRFIAPRQWGTSHGSAEGTVGPTPSLAEGKRGLTQPTGGSKDAFGKKSAGPSWQVLGGLGLLAAVTGGAIFARSKLLKRT